MTADQFTNRFSAVSDQTTVALWFDVTTSGLFNCDTEYSRAAIEKDSLAYVLR